MFLFLLVKREALSGGKACDSLDNVPCSICAKYRDGKNRKKPLDDEDAKCIWLPSINGCKTKAFAEKKGKDYVEICPGMLKFVQVASNFNATFYIPINSILLMLLNSFYCRGRSQR